MLPGCRQLPAGPESARNTKAGAEMLTLPIKKKWWDMIASGEKQEEYRDITPYWSKRFQQAPRILADGKQQFHAVLRAGYRKDSPRLAIRCWVDKGEGKTAWGAERGKQYFRLHITWKEKIGGA